MKTPPESFIAKLFTLNFDTGLINPINTFKIDGRLDYSLMKISSTFGLRYDYLLISEPSKYSNQSPYLMDQENKIVKIESDFVLQFNERK